MSGFRDPRRIGLMNIIRTNISRIIGQCIIPPKMTFQSSQQAIIDEQDKSTAVFETFDIGAHIMYNDASGRLDSRKTVTNLEGCEEPCTSKVAF